MIDIRKPLIYSLILITVLLLAVYGNTLKHEFVWDDADVIVDNPQLEQLSNIPSLFLSEDRIESASGYYRPMTYVSFAIDRAIWGLNPFGFNLTNLVLQILASILFFLTISALFKSEHIALIAALLFALHPIAGETINFHSGGRNTLLCACFALLSLLLYIKNKPIGSILCFAGAIFSKEFGLLLPIFIFIYDRFIRNEKPRLTIYALYLLPIAGYFTLRSYAVESANLLKSLNLTDTIMLAPYLVLKYLLQMVYPFEQKVLYDVHTNIYVAVASFVGIIVLASLVYKFRKHNEILFSACWFLAFLLPVINIILLPAASMMADRYAYFSLMGFAVGLAYLISKAPKNIIIPLVAILCLTYAVVDVKRNTHWKNDYNFYSQMIKDAPDMALGYNDLGIYYYKKGDMVNAEKYLTIASSKKDVTARLLGADAAVFWEANKLDTAEKLLLRQLELEPSNPQPYVMLKMIYDKMGNKELAKKYQDQTTAKFPGMEAMMNQRVMEVTRQAETFMSMRSYERAANLFREALIINPDFVPAIVDMGSISAEKGDAVNAIKYFNRALVLDPLNANAHFNLAQVYEMQGRAAEAAAEMKKYQEAEALSKQKAAQPSK